jgi:hypothetical protein
MTMSKKDYELIAKVFLAKRNDIHSQYLELGVVTGPETTFLRGMEAGLNEVMAHLADALEIDNPRFDHPTFFNACGYPIDVWI